MTNMRRYGLVLIAVLGSVALPAPADQYWVAYEGNDFPENEGWERTFTDANGTVGQGGAIRTLEQGELRLDSLESLLIIDFYRMYRSVDPAPGETFMLEWRNRIDTTEPFEDPGLSVFSDGSRAVAFEFTVSSLRSVLEPEKAATFAPGMYHSFMLTSLDMLDYELWIDDLLALSGSFRAVFGSSRVGWGDVIQGGRSDSTWDYVRFGVVPEPSSFLTNAAGALIGAALLRRNRR